MKRFATLYEVLDRTTSTNEKVAALAARTGAADGAPTWVDDAGLLTGAAGIALALLAAATPVEPAWDRMLLTSIPPRRAGSASRGGRP